MDKVKLYLYYEAIGTGIVGVKEFTHYKIYKGSSEFDKREMNVFIDGIIQECDNLNIPHLTREDIELLKFVELRK